MYLSHDEYHDFGGKIEDSFEFEKLEFDAEVAIDYATFNRLKNEDVVSKRVKRCMYALIELAEKQEQALSLGKAEDSTDGSHITSQSNDGVSTSYNGMKAADVFSACRGEVDTIIQKYLAGERTLDGKKVLLYRGYYPGE